MIAQLSVLMPARKGKNDRAPSDQAVIYEDVVERTVKPPRSTDKHRRGPEHAPLAMALPAEAEDTKSSLRVWKYRYEETIVAALSRWWVVNENTFDDVDGDGVMDLTKDQYLSVLRKVGKALTPPPDYDPDEIEECAAEDWESDSHGLQFMEKEYFMDAIFELVDVWMPDFCDECWEMVDFLDTLLYRCSGGDPRVCPCAGSNPALIPLCRDLTAAPPFRCAAFPLRRPPRDALLTRVAASRLILVGRAGRR